MSHVLRLILKGLSEPSSLSLTKPHVQHLSWSLNSSVADILSLLVLEGAAHPNTAIHSYASRPSDSSNHDNELSNSSLHPPTDTSGSRRTSAKMGSVFLSRINASKETDNRPFSSTSTRSSLDATGSGRPDRGADTPSTLPGFSAKGSADGGTPPHAVADADDAGDAASAVQSLMRRVACSAAVRMHIKTIAVIVFSKVSDDDLSLRQAISHLVFTDDRRVLFLDKRR